MRAYKLSKNSNLSLEEQLKVIENYDIEDLLYALRESENEPREYDKRIVTEIRNKLFEKGITCL